MINLKEFRLAIFDLDGTLINSMIEIENMIKDMLESKNRLAKDDLLHEIAPLGFVKGAEYLKKAYSLDESSENICNAMIKYMKNYYENKVTLRDGAYEYIENIKSKGLKIHIASANQKEFVELALEHTGLNRLIDFNITTEELDTSKKSSYIFEYCANKEDIKFEEVIIFEDSVTAIEISKNKGFYTVGVKSIEVDNNTIDKLKKVSDFYLDSFN